MHGEVGKARPGYLYKNAYASAARRGLGTWSARLELEPDRQFKRLMLNPLATRLDFACHQCPIAILKSVDKNQMLVLALANVPTIITVLIGILLNNGRLNDLNSRFSGLETRFIGMEHKFDNRIEGLEHKFHTRFDLLFSTVVDLDTRIEAQRH